MVILLVLYLKHTDTEYILVDAVVQITGIVSTLIVVRARLGTSASQADRSRTLGDMSLATMPHSRPPTIPSDCEDHLCHDAMAKSM